MDNDVPPVAQTLTWTGAVLLYTTAMVAGHRSRGTIRLYRHYLDHLARYVRRPMLATPAQLRRALSVPHWSAETRKSARSAISSFYRWAVDDGLMADSPAAGLPSVTVPPGKPRPIPAAEYRRALALAAPRERLMLKLGRQAGLRCAEIAQVHREDLVEARIYVTGKGGKTRTVPVLDEELATAIRRADEWLFPNGRGTHLSPGHVSKILGEVLPGQWTAHTLRHGMGTAAYAGTRDLLAVGELLGHSRPETTRRYVLLPEDALLDAARAAAI